MKIFNKDVDLTTLLLVLIVFSLICTLIYFQYNRLNNTGKIDSSNKFKDWSYGGREEHKRPMLKIWEAIKRKYQNLKHSNQTQ